MPSPDYTESIINCDIEAKIIKNKANVVVAGEIEYSFQVNVKMLLVLTLICDMIRCEPGFLTVG